MCDPDLLQKIEQYLEEINKLKETFPSIPEDWELVLELGADDETGEPICLYYFVRHSTRCLFWLHEFDLESVLWDVPGVTEKAHIRESAPAPGARRTNHMTRPGIAIPVLVSGNYIATVTLWPTTPGLIGRRSPTTERFQRGFSRSSVGFWSMRALVRRAQ